MRVAFVTHAGSNVGGAEESLALFLGHLPSPIEPHVVLFEDGKFAERLRKDGRSLEIFDAPPALMSTTRERLSSGAVSAPSTAFRLSRLLRRRGIDVVHTNSMKAHVVGSVAARMAGKPSVLHMHDIVSGSARTVIRAIGATCTRERLACSNAAASAMGLPSTTVINEPLDVARYDGLPSKADARRALGIPPDGPLVAIVGRINRWKGHDKFVRIAARVRRHVDARFAIVGAPVFRDEDFLPEIHRLVAELGLSDVVHFVPWLDDPRLIYAAADLHCNCSDAEPFGRTAVEAAAAGVPTVLFGDGGTSETIRDGVTGISVAPKDEAAFADAVVHYLSDAERLLKAGAACRTFARDFDIVPLAARLGDVLTRAARDDSRC